MKTFTVRAERSGKWWALEVPEVRGVFSQARRLDQADSMVRDAIAAVLDIDPYSFTVDVQPVLPQDVQALLDAVARAKEVVEKARHEAAALVQQAAVTLTREGGFSMRDAGRVMGVSHQRIAQILKENERLGHKTGNLGAGQTSGVRLPKGDPVGPHGAHDGPIGAKVG